MITQEDLMEDAIMQESVSTAEYYLIKAINHFKGKPNGDRLMVYLIDKDYEILNKAFQDSIKHYRVSDPTVVAYMGYAIKKNVIPGSYESFIVLPTDIVNGSLKGISKFNLRTLELYTAV